MSLSHTHTYSNISFIRHGCLVKKAVASFISTICNPTSTDLANSSLMSLFTPTLLIYIHVGGGCVGGWEAGNSWLRKYTDSNQSWQKCSRRLCLGLWMLLRSMFDFNIYFISRVAGGLNEEKKCANCAVHLYYIKQSLTTWHGNEKIAWRLSYRRQDITQATPGTLTR